MLKALLVRAVLFATLTYAFVPPITAVRCPPHWLHRSEDDQCYRAFPSTEQNQTKVRLTFLAATQLCHSHGGVIPVILNGTLQEWLINLIGPTSGEGFWVGVQDRRKDTNAADSLQHWFTDQGRPFNNYFDWDRRRQMPRGEACAIVHAKGDPSRRINGGSNKMSTLTCHEPASVICQRPRVPFHIGSVNLTTAPTHGGMSKVQHIWGDDLTLEFYGSNIPRGTQVTLQTTDNGYFAAEPNRPTNCSKIGHLGGAQAPVTLNVTAAQFQHKHCNGTCDKAHARWSKDLPFVRGAQYSLCFYFPYPFATPIHQDEFRHNALPRVSVEFIQRRTEYLFDVCSRHQHNIDLFYGNGHDDTNRAPVVPFYYDTPYQHY